MTGSRETKKRRDGAADILQVPEDEVVGVEIGHEQAQDGADVPMQGQLVATPSPVDIFFSPRAVSSFLSTMQNSGAFGHNQSWMKATVIPLSC